MDIVHEPQFDTQKIVDIYTEKDGVEITYVCTTDLRASDTPVDVFYRATPHPEFGNRYFGVFYDHMRGNVMITNADIVETLEFGMIEHEGKFYYSQSHHDYKVVGGKMIDGGRAYIRSSGGCDAVMRVINGKFIAKDVEDLVALGDAKEYVYPGSDAQV